MSFYLLVFANTRCLSNEVAFETELPKTCRTLALECWLFVVQKSTNRRKYDADGSLCLMIKNLSNYLFILIHITSSILYTKSATKLENRQKHKKRPIVLKIRKMNFMFNPCICMIHCIKSPHLASWIRI